MASKCSPLSSDNKSGSTKETEGSQAVSQPVQGPKSAPKASAAGEETNRSVAPEPTVQSSHTAATAEDTSFTGGEVGSSSKGEKGERTEEHGGQEKTKRGETECAVENSLR